MTMVLVVGAGPVGLTLAVELVRHGVRCRIIDRLDKPSPYCRAIGVTPRTLEVWDDMGIAQEMIDAGLGITGLRSIVEGQPPVDSVADYAFLPYASLGIPQYETERVLGHHLERSGDIVERGVTLEGLSQSQHTVEVVLSHGDGSTENTCFDYVIGCDGAHSSVRRAADIPFEGDAMPMTFMLGDVHIAWDVPYGMTLRALRLNEGAAPDFFVAVPLPERGRYRISMIAPDALVGNGATGHGIQTDMRGPDLPQLQAVADDLLTDRPTLSDLRWSSIFRISMRLAARYREERVFIAGDAAHIHPPTGGQGMNTGIQDAYNLAWKLALVLDGAPEALLDSYEAERRPIGQEVVARTKAATEGFGRKPSGVSDQLVDTQIPVSYRGSAFVKDDPDCEDQTFPRAGDRAPDAAGLRRVGVGFPLRLHDVIRGTDHVLIVSVAADTGRLTDLADLSRRLRTQLGSRVRVVAITTNEKAREWPGIAVLTDHDGTFAHVYGEADSCFIVRPDGYLGWRGRSWRSIGLRDYLAMVFGFQAAL